MPSKENIKGIIIHCSATKPDWMAGHSVEEKRDEIRRWHVEDNGWSDIAYASVIDRDGSRAAGRDLDKDGDVYEEIGAHTKGMNDEYGGFCLLGGHGSNEKDDFFDHFMMEQEIAALKEIRAIEEYAGRPLPVHGHNEFAAKACPGFDVRVWYPEAVKRHEDNPDTPDNDCQQLFDKLMASIRLKVCK